MDKKLILFAALLALPACDEDSDPIDTGDGEISSVTVDASAGWAHVAIDGETATVVSVSDPTTSADWDIAFNALSVMLNGGAAGPGGVEGYCVCQNASATDAQVIAMTAESELGDFEAVTEAPADEEAWTTEALSTAIGADWYSYDFTTHVVSAAPENVFAVRTASGTGFAKVRVIDIANPTQATAGQVTLEFATQTAAGAAFSAPDTLVVDVTGGAKLVDLETAAIVTSGNDWDLRLEGYDIRVNGGVSGTGSAGAYLTGMSFDEVLDAGAAPAVAFSQDTYAGVFGEHPWFRYNLQNDHQVYPTYEVYLIRRGDDVYKVQLTGYYGTTGAPRQISFRWAPLD